MHRFNPPPSWPEPPSDSWRPPHGWEPNPEWPDAPAGWGFWLNRHGPSRQRPDRCVRRGRRRPPPARHRRPLAVADALLIHPGPAEVLGGFRRPEVLLSRSDVMLPIDITFRVGQQEAEAWGKRPGSASTSAPRACERSESPRPGPCSAEPPAR
ncbi:hypothetical protein F1D05_17965 [Kribbella qitaiheensis]|uniref:Uncharacterized protein n=1 Tax=Kribbella qitaiheensis TaxID=1544730 RepID=A0A7G6WZN9_9ACTN|nr:hypothetical protein F1D05_17965 [Kribbella qitaiheensis]